MSPCCLSQHCTILDAMHAYTDAMRAPMACSANDMHAYTDIAAGADTMHACNELLQGQGAPVGWRLQQPLQGEVQGGQHQPCCGLGLPGPFAAALLACPLLCCSLAATFCSTLCRQQLVSDPSCTCIRIATGPNGKHGTLQLLEQEGQTECRSEMQGL